MITQADKIELLKGLRLPYCYFGTKNFISSLKGKTEMTAEQEKTTDEILYKFRRQIAPKKAIKYTLKQFKMFLVIAVIEESPNKKQ